MTSRGIVQLQGGGSCAPAAAPREGKRQVHQHRTHHDLIQVKISPDHNQISLYELYYFKEGVDPLSDPNLFTEHSFSFDRVYGQNSTQDEVYRNTASDAVNSVLEVRARLFVLSLPFSD